ncbi:Mannose-6-phosphate isomerase 1 [Camellia lanceoleosa]|uniref:Mannose-6-phosphate isomerase 1 n=1 Tax=Camellia lanceoleosa TaxID=1840588 RepID=A0ACC0FMV7_9ERIC|nr:Mannose-6-phosphate isomerase 1 [Camellia lanceoleosa]
MKPSLTSSSGWALTSPNPPLSSKASMIVSIGSDCVGLSLNSWIAKVPGGLCDKVIQKWCVTLSFMFKVLSVSKALSIQAHPDKEFAGFLHKTLPDVFKDDNYKPKMALALTEFEALCGFISLKRIQTSYSKMFCDSICEKSEQLLEVFDVRAKSHNIGYLKGKVLSWVGIPTLVVLLFGVFEKVLLNGLNQKDIVNVARSQSDSDVEVFEAAKAAIEGGDLGIIGDDVFAFGDMNFSPAQGVETICFFPKNPSPSVAVGEEGELIVGMKNEGDILIS